MIFLYNQTDFPNGMSKMVRTVLPISEPIKFSIVFFILLFLTFSFVIML